MNEQQVSWLSKDGLELKAKHWPLDAPRAVLAVVHGMGEHAGRYSHLADYFVNHRFAVIALDQRGHGTSGGSRGHSPSLQHLLEDVDQFLAKCRSLYPNTPLVVYAHSMGGNVVLNYLLRNHPDLSAAVISAPWIQLAFEPPAWKVTAAKILGSWTPKLTLANDLDVRQLSKDTAVAEAYVADPLVHNKISAAMGKELMEGGAWLNGFKGEITIPTLLMHGTKDGLTSHPASASFAKRVSGLLTFKAWEGYFHELHNEPEQRQVFDFVLDWLENLKKF